MIKELKFGDTTAIAEEIGCSTVTVRKALRGEINTRMSRLIISHTELYLRHREERIQQARKNR